MEGLGKDVLNQCLQDGNSKKERVAPLVTKGGRNVWAAGNSPPRKLKITINCTSFRNQHVPPMAKQVVAHREANLFLPPSLIMM